MLGFARRRWPATSLAVTSLRAALVGVACVVFYISPPLLPLLSDGFGPPNCSSSTPPTPPPPPPPPPDRQTDERTFAFGAVAVFARLLLRPRKSVCVESVSALAAAVGQEAAPAAQPPPESFRVRAFCFRPKLSRCTRKLAVQRFKGHLSLSPFKGDRLAALCPNKRTERKKVKK